MRYVKVWIGMALNMVDTLQERTMMKGSYDDRIVCTCRTSEDRIYLCGDGLI